MKHIHIENFGPIKLADFDLKKYNVIIGPQSSGKSCILKIASYCTWVEKRIEVTQKQDEFIKGDRFMKLLVNFHKLQGYEKENTLIEYESQYMKFSYSKYAGFYFNWKRFRWNYKRPKVSYIPAERNLVSVFSNWMDMNLKQNNITDFMADWSYARENVHDASLLNLGVKYHYDKKTNLEKVETSDGNLIDLTNASSGLQSLIPLLLFLQYLTHGIYKDDRRENFKGRSINEELPYIIYDALVTSKGKAPGLVTLVNGVPQQKLAEVPSVFEIIGKANFGFSSREDANQVLRIYNALNYIQRCDTFIEEPEENLFPPTQGQLINWILGNSNKTTFTIATHSPYVLTAFLEQENLDNFNLMYIPNIGEKSVLRIASDDTIREIYGYGVDAFFNIESL